MQAGGQCNAPGSIGVPRYVTVLCGVGGASAALADHAKRWSAPLQQLHAGVDKHNISGHSAAEVAGEEDGRVSHFAGFGRMA